MGRPKARTDEIEEQIIQDYVNRMPIKEICSKHNIHVQSMHNMFIRRGIKEEMAEARKRHLRLEDIAPNKDGTISLKYDKKVKVTQQLNSNGYPYINVNRKR